MKTVIKIPVHLTRLASLEGDEGRSGSQLFSQSLPLPPEDGQIPGSCWRMSPGLRSKETVKCLAAVGNLRLSGQLC